MRRSSVQHEKYVVKVLEKAMKILDVYSRDESAFTLDDLTKRTGLDKSTVFRILRTMEKNGYIRYDQEDGFYRLGLRFMELGGVVHSSTSVRKSAAPYLDALARSLKATILVGIIIDDQFSYIDKKEGDSILRIPSYLGAKMLPVESFLGLTLLAFMDTSERKRLLRQHRLRKHTERTVTRLTEVEARLNHANQKGYFLERGEFFDGVTQIGVPIMGVAGNTVAALGACLQEFRVSGENVGKTVQSLTETAKLISKELGFQGDEAAGGRSRASERTPAVTISRTG
jgi:DNA-binding IclR family transcriptional regulator